MEINLNFFTVDLNFSLSVKKKFQFKRWLIGKVRPRYFYICEEGRNILCYSHWDDSDKKALKDLGKVHFSVVNPCDHEIRCGSYFTTSFAFKFNPFVIIKHTSPANSGN